MVLAGDYGRPFVARGTRPLPGSWRLDVLHAGNGRPYRIAEALADGGEAHPFGSRRSSGSELVTLCAFARDALWQATRARRQGYQVAH